MSAISIPTRDRLLHAAREIVEDQGYAGATVAAISARAGVASGTLYRHFPSKEQLFVELFRQVCDRDIAVMQQAASSMPPGGPAVDTLVEIVLTFARRALKRPRLAWALLAEPVDPSVDLERLAYRERHTALLMTTIVRAAGAGEIPEQDGRVTAAALVGGCSEVLVGPLSPASWPTSDHEQLLASIEALVRRAVGASS